MEFLYKNKFTLLIVLVIILLLTNFSSCYKNILTNKESKRVIEVYEQNIVALNDSIKKVVDKNGDTVFVEKAVHGNLDDIINSSAFKQLSKEPFLIYCFAYSLMMALGIGLSTSNFGALVRFKIPLLPFLVFGLLYVYDNYKKKKEEKTIEEDDDLTKPLHEQFKSTIGKHAGKR